MTLVVMPTYDEADNIEPIVRTILEKNPDVHILIVDDNSPDGTGRIALWLASREPRLHVIQRLAKDGLAAAYVAGFRWGLERGYRRFVQMDADFSHDPAELPNLLAALDRGADVATGCRYVSGGGTEGWSLLRRTLSRGGNLYARTVLGLAFNDMTSGFNAWSAEALQRVHVMDIRAKGYGYQIELKSRAHRAGLAIREVPIHFRERAAGRSKMSLGIAWEAVLMVLTMRLKA